MADTNEPTEREWLEGLRYEDKFPPPDSLQRERLAAIECLLVTEVARQDVIHPDGYPATRDGVRLGLATLQDELDETLDAWRKGRPRGKQKADWHDTENELGQVLAVGIRLLRSIREWNAQHPQPESFDRVDRWASR